MLVVVVDAETVVAIDAQMTAAEAVMILFRSYGGCRRSPKTLFH